MVEHLLAMQGIAGSSPGVRILRKKVIISWDLKFTRVLSQDAAWRENQEIQTRRISGKCNNRQLIPIPYFLCGINIFGQFFDILENFGCIETYFLNGMYVALTEHCTSQKSKIFTDKITFGTTDDWSLFAE